MKTVNMTIISTILILFIGFNMIDQLVTVFAPDFEPIYSMQYASYLISSILEQPFPNPRYNDMEIMDFTFRMWLTPTPGTGVTVLIIYMLLSLVFASIIFKRRQL